MRYIHLLICMVCSIATFSQLYQVPVYTATSLQSAQPGSEIGNAIDNNITTIYHSSWTKSGIPDELKFYFDTKVKSIKKIVYSPRQSGPNGIWTNLKIFYSTQANPTQYIQIGTNLNWALDNTDKEYTLPNSIANPFCIKFEVDAAGGNFSSCAEMRFYSESQPEINNGLDCIVPTTILAINGANDIKAQIEPNGTTASSFQPGEDISKSYDNNPSTHYHSSWSNTILPVVLNYRLDGFTPIDFLKYTPRTDGGDNGNFGNVTITYNTLTYGAFQELMTFNFKQNGLPTIVNFPKQIIPANIRITVADGNDGFVSCAEMEFFTADRSSLSLPYLNIFTDNLYAYLRANISQTQIDTISNQFYKRLAQCIFDRTYQHKYRVQSYEVYPTLSTLRQALKVGQYDQFENPTGIAFKSGEKIALFARNLPSSTNIYLTVKDFSTDIGNPISHYPLTNGLNVFLPVNSGLGYISYFSDIDSLNEIDINIVTGSVNGYFDRATTTKTEWAEMLSNSAYPSLDIVGKYVHMVYGKSGLKIGSPFDGLSLIAKYDSIVMYERQLMGLFKYSRSPKNHQLAFAGYGGGFYAGGYGVHLDYTWGIPGLTDPNQLGLWGIAHEFGHINQIRPDLLWIGTTEVTNNIYTIWVDYKMNRDNHPYARLESSSSSPVSGMTSYQGGKINGALLNTLIDGNHVQGNSEYDVFEILVPFWQLQLYYQEAGAAKNAPALSFDYPGSYTGTDYARWYGTVAEVARTSTINNLTHGERLLNFVKNTCAAVQEDLTDFFIKTGFLRPIDIRIDDYGVAPLKITQSQVDATIAEIKGQNFQKPVSPVLHYICAHSVNAFKHQLPLSGQNGEGVTLAGDYLTIDNSKWKNAIVFETYDERGQLIFVSITGTGDVTNQITKVFYPVITSTVYAVGFDGQRILVYPKRLGSTDEKNLSSLKIYPNPTSNNDVILSIDHPERNFQASMVTMDGCQVFYSIGTIKEIETALNQNLNTLHPAVYFLVLKNSDGTLSRTKFVKL